jgi:restriction system protein
VHRAGAAAARAVGASRRVDARCRARDELERVLGGPRVGLPARRLRRQPAPGPAADFEIAKEGRRAVVAGKRWKVARTGIEALRDLEGAKDARDAHECIYVAAGDLTDNARAFATQKRIRLIGGPELARLVPDAGRKRAREAA